MDPNDETGFTNQVIDPHAIPNHAEVSFNPMASTFRRYLLQSTALQFLPLLGGTAVLWFLPVFQAGPALVAGAVGLVGLASMIAVHRWFDAGYRGWVLREHDLIARAGVIWRAITALPIARIQHVETTHGPLERLHGLARLKLYTAGGMTADLVLIGLPLTTADQLREYLVEQIRKRDSEAAQSGHE